MITLSEITVKQFLFVVTVEAYVITLGERYTNDPINQISLSCKGVICINVITITEYAVELELETLAIEESFD
jgi:hypothetical protein